ncbi:MAG: S-methyl-5-thioribose-1-phosphate isomerase, partial [Chloroflexota bacterium]
MNSYPTIEWTGETVRMLDQRLLPHQVIFQEYRDPAGVAEAIRDMVIRGAPAIGAAAAYGLALAAVHSQAGSAADLRAELGAAAEVLRRARPTAVNLT